MSIDRGDRIIVVMARSLCCCANRGAKVADSNEEIIGKQQLKNVFIVCTQNVVTRGLAGKLIGCLEDRHLLPVHMKLVRPTQEVIDKSQLLKEERRRQLDDVWMLVVFRGRDAMSRVADCVRLFKQQYSLHKHDIYWTETEQQAKHEEQLWFPPPEVEEISTANGAPPPAPEAVEQSAEGGEHKEAGAVVDVVEIIPEENGASLVSLKQEGSEASEGVQASLNSSRLDSPEPVVLIDKAADEPTAEVISNTAVILEPAHPTPSPSPAPASAPAPAPSTIQQPTQIE